MTEIRNAVLVGDVFSRLADVPDDSIQTCITSPPYWGLRDYGTGHWEGGDAGCEHKRVDHRQKQGVTSCRKGRSNVEAQRNQGFRNECDTCGARRIDAQIGLEKTPEEYRDKMVAVFREVRRVLRDDGTIWLNLGDSYNAGGRVGHGTRTGYKQQTNRASAAGADRIRPSAGGLKPKDLVGIPWRVAFALQADGWYLRSDIIWSKPSVMPESVTDRPTKAHEYIFLMSKNAKYFYDADAIKTESRSSWNSAHLFAQKGTKSERIAKTNPDLYRTHGMGSRHPDRIQNRSNRRTVWEIATQPHGGAHFATFPEKLIEPCVLAGSRPGDVVLDPFMGSGTVAVVAKAHGRDYLGIELNPEYADLIEARVAAGPKGLDRKTKDERHRDEVARLRRKIAELQGDSRKPT